MSDDLWFEGPSDELDEGESPDEDDFDDDSTLTMPCSQCGAEIYEDAVRCPVCGGYVTSNTSIWSGRPTWWILMGLVGILALVLALAGLVPR